MLDWDKPLSEQSDYVKNAINKSEYALRDMAFDITGNNDPTGGQIAKTAMNPKEFSQHLRELGIPGIKYLDAGSRGQGGTGTRNFVIFPGEEKNLKILERNGQKPTPQELGKALQSMPSKQDVQVDLYPVKNRKDTLNLARLVVDPEKRKQGLGSKAMQEIIDSADAGGKTITLSPSTDFGATSVTRLKNFYKRFGFVENKGRNKDFTINESMYRVPQSLENE
jgi:predicted GNAT family acetyltransferase